MLAVQFNQGVNSQGQSRFSRGRISFTAIERTLLGIKPDAFEKGLAEILKQEALEKTGLKMVAGSEEVRSREIMGNHYAVHKERGFFGELIDYVTRGKFGAYVLEGDNAVAKLRGAAFELRNKYAPGAKAENLIHSSDSVENAQAEIDNFFPTLDKMV